MVFAAVKMSPRSAVPMAAASRAIRTNPSRRDSTVPAAITPADRRVRSAILRTDSFFQDCAFTVGCIRSRSFGYAVRLGAIVGGIRGVRAVGAVGAVGGLAGVRSGRRLVAE